MTVVLEGQFADGHRWEIEAGGTDEDFSTTLHVYRDDQMVEGSGMAGPRLYEGRPVNAGYGISDDRPCTEVIRADPSVERLVLTTDRGNEIEIRLSETHETFGLRFGAVQLPIGHLPDVLRAESGGVVIYSENQHGLRRFRGGPPSGASGWRPAGCDWQT